MTKDIKKLSEQALEDACKEIKMLKEDAGKLLAIKPIYVIIRPELYKIKSASEDELK